MMVLPPMSGIAVSGRPSCKLFPADVRIDFSQLRIKDAPPPQAYLMEARPGGAFADEITLLYLLSSSYTLLPYSSHWQ